MQHRRLSDTRAHLVVAGPHAARTRTLIELCAHHGHEGDEDRQHADDDGLTMACTKGVERGWDFRIEKAGRATFDAPGLDMSSAPCAGGSGDVPAAGPGEPPAAPSALHGMDGR